MNKDDSQQAREEPRLLLNEAWPYRTLITLAVPIGAIYVVSDYLPDFVRLSPLNDGAWSQTALIVFVFSVAALYAQGLRRRIDEDANRGYGWLRREINRNTFSRMLAVRVPETRPLSRKAGLVIALLAAGVVALDLYCSRHHGLVDTPDVL